MGIIPPCPKCGGPRYYEGHSPRCRPCRLDAQKRARRARAEKLSPCADCGALLPHKELTRRTRRCAACARANERAMEAAYKQRPEIKQREAAWMRQKRAADRDRARAQGRESMRRQRAADPQKNRDGAKRWRQKYPERLRAQNRRTKMQWRAVPIEHTPAQWEAMKAYFSYRCLCCGRYEPEIVLTEDHVIPITRGGTDHISNIQPLCFSCNSAKGNRHETDYRKVSLLCARSRRSL
jgi:5-methylcytosine-specific restriction endonuclease McrA